MTDKVLIFPASTDPIESALRLLGFAVNDIRSREESKLVRADEYIMQAIALLTKGGK